MVYWERFVKRYVWLYIGVRRYIVKTKKLNLLWKSNKESIKILNLEFAKREDAWNRKFPKSYLAISSNSVIIKSIYITKVKALNRRFVAFGERSGHTGAIYFAWNMVKWIFVRFFGKWQINKDNIRWEKHRVE